MEINKKRFLLYSVSILLIFIVVKIILISRFYEQGKYISDTSNIAGDAAHYIDIGENIYLYNSYSDDFSGFPTERATWRPPIWPLVISFFYQFSSSFLVFIILKTILITSLVIFTLLCLRKVFEFSGLYALLPLLILFEPQFKFYSLTFLTEDFTASLILLYFFMFINFKFTKLYSCLFGILSGIIILTHPISLLFIVLTLTLLFIHHFNRNRVNLSLLYFCFCIVISIWPIRNHITFNKGPYLTTSQGITMAKSWNDSIVYQFNNVDGSMIDPRSNLRYIKYEGYKEFTGDIEESKLYKAATINFIKQSSLSELFKIAFVKIKSNFNPFPEKKQEMFLNKLSIPFRILYLLLFFQTAYLLLFKRKYFNEIEKNSLYFVAIIFFAQFLTAIIFYTGLRFNIIYSITMLYIFLAINYKYFKQFIGTINHRKIRS
jgi:hypothetical protein